jgi:hypothetical protein
MILLRSFPAAVGEGKVCASSTVMLLYPRLASWYDIDVPHVPPPMTRILECVLRRFGISCLLLLGFVFSVWRKLKVRNKVAYMTCLNHEIHVCGIISRLLFFLQRTYHLSLRFFSLSIKQHAAKQKQILEKQHKEKWIGSCAQERNPKSYTGSIW